MPHMLAMIFGLRSRQIAIIAWWLTKRKRHFFVNSSRDASRTEKEAAGWQLESNLCYENW